MPIGKDSITKRVAKQTEEKIDPELVATTAAAPKATAKKAPAASTAKKTTSTTQKKTTTAKKPSAPKAEPVKETAPVVEEKKVETAVLANVSPETVAAVIGHKEDEKYEKVQIGQKMPDFLL